MFTITITTGNAAFEEAGERWEIARMLRGLAAKLAETDADSGVLRDSNGNGVGQWSFVED